MRGFLTFIQIAHGHAVCLHAFGLVKLKVRVVFDQEEFVWLLCLDFFDLYPSVCWGSWHNAMDVKPLCSSIRIFRDISHSCNGYKTTRMYDLRTFN